MKDCHLFHVTNSIGQGHPQNETGNADWRYEDKPVNTMRSNTIISRILVAKISANTSLASVAEHIRPIVEAINIVQRDPKWTCRIWVEQALEALHAAGGEFSVIPSWRVANGIFSILVTFRTVICATSNECVSITSFAGFNQEIKGIQVRETKDDIHALFYDLPSV